MAYLETSTYRERQLWNGWSAGWMMRIAFLEKWMRKEKMRSNTSKESYLKETQSQSVCQSSLRLNFLLHSQTRYGQMFHGDRLQSYWSPLPDWQLSEARKGLFNQHSTNWNVEVLTAHLPQFLLTKIRPDAFWSIKNSLDPSKHASLEQKLDIMLSVLLISFLQPEFKSRCNSKVTRAHECSSFMYCKSPW